MRDLLSRFVTAIDAEIALIEKESRDQSFELLSGQRAEGSTGALYVFIMADALRLPEDSSGQLKAGGAEFPAMVVAQEGNRIWVLVESTDELPSYFPAARLVLNETELLKRLREKILLLGSGSDLGLAAKVFGRESSREGVATVPPFVEQLLGSSPQTLMVLAQCLGSEVTFLWGPPGTGKTFTIAALVASLASLGETVLVTSHTHVAVEQALWALIEPPEGNRVGGLLFESSLVSDGRILKVGKRRLDKIPRSVELECYLEDKAKERGETVRILEEERDRVAGIVAALTSESLPWSDLAAARTGLSLASADHEGAVQSYAESRRLRDGAKARLDAANLSEGQAKRSFFLGRAGRVAKARRMSAEIRGEVRRAEAAAGVAEARVVRLRATLADADAALSRARTASAGSRQESQLQTELASAEERRGTLQSEIDALNDSAGEDANELIHNAAAIFATLTKLYMDRGGLSDMRWDTVVIDEASMAMPPLVAYAAAHARKRVVIVGDPFQLPPVVHSGSGTEGGELGKDVFELRGVKDMIEEGISPAYLATLRTQWRMHPDIVSVAKELISAYSFLETAHGLGKRNAVGVHDALNTTAPLITVDISGFHPWSGKMPGSLSRFNFVSAQACVEIASMYAASLTEPNENAAPPIGIVTPYAAQRRYLNKLIEMLNLGRWVMAGTVHTFQGNECDVIIFDSVLGEPHWTARLTNPFSFEEVKRDLNVALTRARHQFVFVGDSKWLRKNAKPASAYGKLWGYMEGHADHLDATDLLGDGFRTRVAQGVSDVKRWTLTRRKSVTFLTETDFYAAFTNDLNEAKDRVILYTPFIGTTRWPSVEPHIAAMRQRGVAVYLLHKPLSDPDWKRGNQDFGKSVFERLSAIGVKLIPISGVHAKTIVIDGRIVYEGSLNWASQTVSYEHMWRFESGDMAALVEKMLQLKPIVEAYTQEKVGDRCPSCAGRLMLINQAQQSQRDVYPVKLGCYNHAEDKESCEGYLRRVDGRAPFLRPPTCGKGSRMEVHLSQSGKPWNWRCAHKGCKAVRWARGDCTG